MDILMRNYGHEQFVWKKAKFVNGNIVIDNDATVLECDIVSIRNDIRKKYVQCSECGKTFKKGSPKIEKHKEPIRDSHMCFGCRYLRQSIREQKSQKYELLENGNYLSKTKSEVFLYCYNSYTTRDINSEEARHYCIYNRCNNATMRDVKGFFIDKPGAFDELITIDKVLEKGYSNAYTSAYDNLSIYYLKARNTIGVRVNALNIVDGFDVQYKNHDWRIYYSKKYDELYEPRNGTYRVWNPGNMYKDTRDYIKAKIAALYE